ncbi:hypothetical protein KDE13_08340 [Campylobacter sp. faydin G-140]|uniref:hypothetical protein n=1 Tax=Campylobacter anatolicus TaxID=2829105 RepID=UPI001B9A5865|nr:hypothetical protein [Campylobacter anatolicus]MBR8466340.1 hypothetical protein [Campylobacter anatolicus]
MIPSSTEFKQALKNRANSALFNQDEITDEALDMVCAETNEECKGRDVKSWAMMDFAFIRLKIYLKIALSEEDIVLLKTAMSEIKSSTLSGQTKNSSSFIYKCI